MSKSYSHLLSSFVTNLEESSTLKMAQLARNLKAKGIDVINLSLGEPDFDTPQHIKDAAIKALEMGMTKYSPVAGIAELRQEIVNKFRRENNMDFEVDNIVVSNGSKQGFANICFSLMNDGDEVIILCPYWVSHFEIVKMTGGIPIVLKGSIDDDFKPTPDQLEKAISPKTKMVVYSSPCNPTGTVFSKEELEAFASIISKHPDIIIVADEIYEYINFEGKTFSMGSIPSVKDQTITLNGFAKGFAMTGWRLGYMGAPKEIAQACIKVQGQITSGANSFGQYAAAVALRSDLAPSMAFVKAFKKRRDLLIGLMNQIPDIKSNTPSGAFYLFPDVSKLFGKSNGSFKINSSNDLCDYLLNHAHVALVSGEGFGEANCIRISYAASESDLEKAMARIKKAVEELS